MKALSPVVSDCVQTLQWVHHHVDQNAFTLMLFLFSKACSHSSCVFMSKFNSFFVNEKANWKIRTKYNLLCASRQKSNLLMYHGFITLDHVSINTSGMANTRSSVE